MFWFTPYTQRSKKSKIEQYFHLNKNVKKVYVFLTFWDVSATFRTGIWCCTIFSILRALCAKLQCWSGPTIGPTRISSSDYFALAEWESYWLLQWRKTTSSGIHNKRKNWFISLAKPLTISYNNTRNISKITWRKNYFYLHLRRYLLVDWLFFWERKYVPAMPAYLFRFGNHFKGQLYGKLICESFY